MIFKEVWSIEPMLRLGTMRSPVQAHHGNQVMLHYVDPPVMRRDNPIPAAALDTRYENTRPHTMVMTQQRIVDPHMLIPDFQFEQDTDEVHEQDTDEVHEDYDIRSGERRRHVTRRVGTVELPRFQNARQMVDYLQRLGRFLDQYGFTPADPQELYFQWCELEGVQPVSVRDGTGYPTALASINRLERLFEARQITATRQQIEAISDRIEAASATQRSYEEGMRALMRSIEGYSPRASSDPGATIYGEPAAQVNGRVEAYLTYDMVSDLHLWIALNRPDQAMPQQPPLFDVREVRPQGEPIGDVMRRVVEQAAPPPELGIRIPINHPGRRAVNMENTNEVREAINAPDRGNADRRGSTGRDAGRPRRSIRLDN